MKKIIFPFSAIMLILVSMVLAVPMPHLIYGRITTDGYDIKNLEVNVRNTKTDIEGSTFTDLNGRYQIDLGNIDEYYRDGDKIEVTLLYCQDLERCSKSTIISGGGNELSWDISDVPDEAIIVTKIENCWDGTQIINNEGTCPERIVCSDGSEVHSEAECPPKPEEPKDRILEIVLGILSALLAIAFSVLAKFKWGKGFVGLANYYKRLGDEARKRKDYAAAKKYYERAAKMVSTAVTKAKDGSYE